MRKIAGELLREHPDLRPPCGWIESLQVRYIRDQLYVFVRSVISKDDIIITKTMLERLQRKLSHQLDKPAQNRMIVIPVDLEVISVSSDFKMVEPGQ